MEDQTVPVGIGGALVLLLMTLIPAAPRIWAAVALMLENIGMRMKANSNVSVQSSDAFQILQSEVTHLREQRNKDQQRIAAAEAKADAAEIAADEIKRSVDKLQLQVNVLQRELDFERGANLEKDKRIRELEDKLVILIQHNTELRRELDAALKGNVK
jgi:chromosome segregation ATPase